MMLSPLLKIWFAILLVGWVRSSEGSEGTELYTRIHTINLSVSGSIAGHGDWVAYDANTSAVWLSHSPDQNVVILDTNEYNVRATIPYVIGGNGIAFTNQYAIVADNEGDVVRVYDKFTLVLAQVLNTPGGPDGVYWDEATDMIWVTLDDLSEVWGFSKNESSNWVTYETTPSANITLFTPVSNSRGPDVGVIFNSILYQSIDNVINVIDLNQKNITKIISLPSNGTAKGVAYDSETGNLLIGMNVNVSLLMSSQTGDLVSAIHLAGGIDEVVIVSSLRRGYLADKVGFIDIIDLDTGALLSSVNTSIGAHTMTVVDRDFSTEIWSYQDRLNLVAVFEHVKNVTLSPSTSPSTSPSALSTSTSTPTPTPIGTGTPTHTHTPTPTSTPTISSANSSYGFETKTWIVLFFVFVWMTSLSYVC